jgi:O-methyltransferase involved in polyketide biosynthesis
VSAFPQPWPEVRINCAPVEESQFFGRQFDAILAWGLVFLLSAGVQRELIRRIRGALKPGWRLLFTSPAEAVAGNHAVTGKASRSLGATEYERELLNVGLPVVDQFDDEGKNHYFDVEKEPD